MAEKKYVDNFPEKKASLQRAFELKRKEDAAIKEESERRSKKRAGLGENFKENMSRGRIDEMGNAYKKGGEVKKYAAGGAVTPPPAPKKKDTMPEWAKNERENMRKDKLVDDEAKAGDKARKEGMGKIGFKNGGSASSRADGCAIKGKTRGKMY
jgi:hypothetical protein